MFKKDCKLTRASRYFMGGGGGGGGDINIKETKPGDVPPWLQMQQNQLGQYIQNNPLVQQANTGASNFWNQLPGLTKPISDFAKQVPAFFSGLYPGLKSSLADQTSNIKNVFQPVVASGGALTSQGERDVSQRQRLLESQLGTGHTVGALGRELLNRDTAQQQRLQTYSGLENQAMGVQSGLTGQLASLFGQQGGLTSALSQAQQGLQTGGLNQLLGVQSGNISGFTGLEAPAIQLLLGNQQARIAEAQAQAQSQIADQNKSGATGGSIIGAIGSIAGPIIAGL